MIDIQKALPHRPPFLLVDEVVSFSMEGRTIRTRKTAAPDDPVFAGHFPGCPIMPGVLICEAIVQSGAILLAQLAHTDARSIPVLTRLNNAKFKRMVRPGDVLDIEVSLKEILAGAFFMEGRASVNGKAVASVEFACAAVRRDGKA